MKIDPLYLNPHQARKSEPTAYEIQLGDAIEQAFGQGIWELQPLVSHLNQSGVLAHHGQAWTESNFQEEMRRLSA